MRNGYLSSTLHSPVGASVGVGVVDIHVKVHVLIWEVEDGVGAGEGDGSEGQEENSLQEKEGWAGEVKEGN